MALNIEKGVITSPGGTGNQTYNLPANFDPKALILWCAYNTAEGAIDGDGRFSSGFATYRSSSVQQRYLTVFDTDNVGTTACARGYNTTAVLKGFSNATPTVDFEVDFVSFATGASSNFVLNWVDLPATASIKVHYFVIGGSDMTDAWADSFTHTQTDNQDVTTTVGFGQPDLLLFMGTDDTSLTDSAGHATVFISAAKSNTSRRASMWRIPNATGTNMFSWQADRAILINNGVAINGESDLDVKANWPVDGFRLVKPDLPTLNRPVLYLALKGIFTSTIGFDTVPTAGAPQTQNLAHTVPPKGALIWGTNVPTTVGLNVNNADLAAFQLAGTDGTNEGGAGLIDDDAAATTHAGRFHFDTKAVRMYSPTTTTPTLESECDSSFSGNNLVLTWNDTDTVAREYNYLILGSSTATEKTYGAQVGENLPNSGSITFGTTGSW